MSTSCNPGRKPFAFRFPLLSPSPSPPLRSCLTRLTLSSLSSMQVVSKQRILNVMGTFRPAFRGVAQALTDIDLILVEEAFERLLLDYDRVFSSMGIPACLWRRTGE